MTMQHKAIKGEAVKLIGGATYEEHMERIKETPIIERFDVRWGRINANHLYAAALRTPDDSPWFTLAVTPKCEKVVEEALSAAGVEALVPMRMTGERKRRYRVLPPKPAPVILGYVLVRCFKSDSAVMGLINVEHVHAIVGGYVNPLRSTNEKVQEFKRLAEEGRFDEHGQDVEFAVGDMVKVVYGMVAGYEGSVTAIKGIGKGNVGVDVNASGRLVPFVFPLAMLQKL